MSTLITRLTNTGTFLTNGVFDEVSIAGGSLSFNGINQFLTVPASTNLNIGGGSNFTIEAWIYLTATPQNPDGGGIVVQDDGSSSGQCFQFRIDSSTNYLDFIYFTSSSRGSAVSVKSTTAVSINSWTHVAVTLSGTSLKLYINGILVGSGTVSGTIYSASITTGIGSYNYYFYPLYFPGYITNVRIVNGTAVYTSNFTPPTQPLTAITNTQLLLDVASPAAYITDSSTNNFIVTNNNSVTYNSQTPVPITTPAERYSTAGYSVSGILNEITLKGGSLSFNGTNNIANTTANLKLAASTTPFTVEAWIYPTTVTGFTFGEVAPVLNIGNESSGRMSFGIATNAVLAYNNYGYGNETLSSSGAIVANVWQHVAFVSNGTTVTGYINGVSSGSFTIGTGGGASNVIGNASGFYVGQGSTGYTVSNSFSGYITNIRYVNGTAVYTSNFTPPTQPLTAITNTQLLLDVASPSAYITDGSTNNFTLTNVNSVTYNSLTPFPQKRITSTGNCLITGIFDEVTGIS